MVRSCTVQAVLPVLAALLLASPAVGQAGKGTSESPPKTVTWYADHQRERAQRQLACIDDPGHLALNPDCVNAQQASVEVALRQARSRTGTLDPRKPEFWSSDPQTRRNKLLMCRSTPGLQYCDVARRSLMIEAGKAK
jgi:hypothetical protein